jgi:hypothetical protein
MVESFDYEHRDHTIDVEVQKIPPLSGGVAYAAKVLRLVRYVSGRAQALDTLHFHEHHAKTPEDAADLVRTEVVGWIDRQPVS